MPDRPTSAAPTRSEHQPGSRTHLRLVSPPSGHHDAHRLAHAQRCTRELRGVVPGISDWRASALHDLLRSLNREHGTVRLLSIFDGQPRLRVETFDAPGTELQDQRLDWALQAAWPMYRFGKALAQDAAPHTEWPVQHVLQALPLHLHGRPGNHRQRADGEPREAWMPHRGR
jgi:hypothetical protein